jgi:hypothetical protein
MPQAVANFADSIIKAVVTHVWDSHRHDTLNAAGKAVVRKGKYRECVAELLSSYGLLVDPNYLKYHHSSKYLARTLKIIMHSNYVHTRNHPHRTHLPLQLELTDLQAVEAPIHPVLGTGMHAEYFNEGDRVKVWHLLDWWHGKVAYKTRTGTFNVRWHGSSSTTTGILPSQMKMWENID